MNAQNKVMFVDDEEGVRLGYDRYFSVHGFDVETAINGERAVDKLRESPADVVVADLRMPEMDGIQLLEWIHDEQPDTKFILLTGYGSDAVERRARELGAFEYLNKPIRPDTLAAVVTAATILGNPVVQERLENDTSREALPTEQAALPEEEETEGGTEVAATSSLRRTLQIVFALIGAPLLGLAFVIFLPVIGFGALFWMLGKKVALRFQHEAV